MKLYLWKGLDGENVPKDVTHVIVDDCVTTIKSKAILHCHRLVSVIMGDNVEGIDEDAFSHCYNLRWVQLSKTLEYIGQFAFLECRSLDALFLPSTLKSIEGYAFYECNSLRLLLLPRDIDNSNVGDGIIYFTKIAEMAEDAGCVYVEDERYEDDDRSTVESIRRVNEWLMHHMDEAPFHKICYDVSVTAKQINDFVIENGTDSALAIDTIHGITPLHMLAMNPHAPADAIAALFNSNMEAFFILDNKQKIPLDYVRDYNVGGLVGIIQGLCNHRNS